MVSLLNKMYFPDFHMLEPLIEVTFCSKFFTNCLEGLRMNTELYDVINLTSAWPCINHTHNIFVGLWHAQKINLDGT